MKRIFALTLVVFVLACPVFAGDVDSPGKQEPPCTQNCVAPAPTPVPVSAQVVLMLLSLIKV